jgi:hypothetical protein
MLSVALNNIEELQQLINQGAEQIDMRLKKMFSDFLNDLSSEIEIDSNNSFFKEADHIFEFFLNDKGNFHCPLFIRVEDFRNVDMIIGKDVFYLENVELNDDNDFGRMKSALYDFGYSEIFEKATYCKKDLLKVSYTVKQEINKKIKDVIYSRRFGIRPCLFQRQENIRKFQPWLIKL